MAKRKNTNHWQMANFMANLMGNLARLIVTVVHTYLC